MIWINHSPHLGNEMPGVHPMLVASPAAFNAKTSIVIGFPMTHSSSNDSNAFAVKIEGPGSEVAYILSHQPKSFDWKQRNAMPHKWGGGHAKVLAESLAKLDAICGICAP